MNRTSAIPDKFKFGEFIFIFILFLQLDNPQLMSLCQSPFRPVHQYGVWHILLKLQNFSHNDKDTASSTDRSRITVPPCQAASELSGKFVQTIFQLESHLGLNSSDLILIFSLKIWILHAYASLTRSEAIFKYIC